MDGLRCTNCGQPLDDDAAFCGRCGARTTDPQRVTTSSLQGPRDPFSPPLEPRDLGLPGAARQPTETLKGQWGAPPAQSGTAAPFFSHEPPRKPSALNNATRYLCAAAYLNDHFANRVIRELIATRRAVAPSVDVDLGPIIWHCQRARRIFLIRDVMLVVIALLGLVLSPSAAVVFLGWALILGGLLPMVKKKRRGPAVRVLSVVAALVALAAIGALIFAIISSAAINSFSSDLGSGSSVSDSAGSALFKIVGAFLLLLALTWGIEFAFLRVTLGTLAEELAPGYPPPARTPGPAHARVAIVEGAQWGNITLFASKDPFIGAGTKVDRDWSLATRLDPADPARHGPSMSSSPSDHIRIDLVELHQAIRDKLLSLNDPRLPSNERIAALSVSQRLIGSGVLHRDSPLIDPALMTPYSRASPEAIEAIIRHPQAGLRYYQHVAVSDQGAPVTIGGRRVLDAADPGIAISAFVYAAVEGRHFYLQFVRAALPPIDAKYQVIDFLPRLSSRSLLVRQLSSSLKRFFGATAAAPARIMRAFRLWLREQRVEKNTLLPGGAVAADLGAEISVRELGTAEGFGSYFLDLDVQKYTRIMERTVLEAVEDFLSSKGIDTSAFTDSALKIINAMDVRLSTESPTAVSGRGQDRLANPIRAANTESHHDLLAAVMRQQEDLQEELQRHLEARVREAVRASVEESAIGPPLANFVGYIAIELDRRDSASESIRTSKGTIIASPGHQVSLIMSVVRDPSALADPAMAASRAGKPFYVFEPFDIQGGTDSRVADFRALVESPTLTPLPHREDLRVETEAQAAFTFRVPDEAGTHEVWFQLYQAGRLVQVAAVRVEARAEEPSAVTG